MNKLRHCATLLLRSVDERSEDVELLSRGLVTLSVVAGRRLRPFQVLHTHARDVDFLTHD